MKKLNFSGLPGAPISKLSGSMRLAILLLFLIIGSELLALAILNNARKFTHPAFADVIETSGIKREVGLRGVAWADYDNDGYLDLLITGQKTRLYHNNRNGTFTDITEKAGIFPKSSTAGIFGDYDNDGCKDIFFVGYDDQANSLYHNNCNGKFTNVAEKAKIKKTAYRGFGAAWADYDNDGYLDLYVASYGIPTFDPRSLISQSNVLYHNNKDGTFSDVTEKAGVDGFTNCGEFIRKYTVGAPEKWPFKESFQPVWFDYNNDGKIDLFIATDAGISPLYRNNGDGSFTEVTKEAGLCRGGTGMGASVGDYDNDGYLDLYVTNVGSNFLWHNNGNGTFSEVGADAGVVNPLTLGWGANFFDYDNDGYLDLYSVNGTVSSRYGITEIGRAHV